MQQPCSVFLGPYSLGREELQTSISFSEIWYPGLGKGGKDCVFVVILKDFSIFNEELIHYSKSV